MTAGCAAELAIGVDVAHFGTHGIDMIGIAFVGLSGLLKAGHATQPQC